ncbi:hypothetical protein CAPTEDRAFT_168560 [Capitella teleta]|uniref:C-Maf-inducing protein PH domain-containing protein n=1 Tax=Capitella teleta TaxID=283909 RepID=R7T3S6_CAPTE|nr:hypothetical protein CAPTEDRAFT_168560 [Capitella teleta]|eukprot:ELT87321.1 hypothetical protein CAPTEDRAFT_168560 [Capitella teleta]
MASTTADETGSSSNSSSSSSAEGSLGSPSPPDSPQVNGHSKSPQKTSNSNGPKYKLLHEGDIQLCKLNHTRTIVSKIMNSKYLRRWESHHLVLGSSELYSLTPTGFMDLPLLYSSIEDVNIISRWDAGQKFCIRITIGDGSVLLQANNSYLRDQWLHSVQWKRQCMKFEKLLKNTRRPEVLIKEIKNMISLSLHTPIQDGSVFQFPLDLVSQLLQESTDTISRVAHEQIIVALAPLLEHNHPTQEICDFFSKHCKNSPRSQIVIELFTPVVHRILKHNMDFGKFPRMRTFIQEYVQALSSQNDGIRVVQNFVMSMHGISSTCPHPRVLPNLVAVCLAAIYQCYEDKKAEGDFLCSCRLEPQHQRLFQVWVFTQPRSLPVISTLCNAFEFLIQVDRVLGENPNLSAMAFFFPPASASLIARNLVSRVTHVIFRLVVIIAEMADYEDWRPHLGSLLQPIPFPDDALGHEIFTSAMKKTIETVGNDPRCDVHQTVLGIRDGKEGWFHLYCPGGIACDDDGGLFSILLKRLMECCCRRKKFLQSMSKMISPCMLLALRENEAAMDVLCAVLEFEIIESADLKMQMITTLQSTEHGKHMYAALCERQIQLRELQQKGGPRKLTLPSKSTDADLAKMLCSGSFGNLECLSLAFTQVTSACANDLVKLPSLRYLNLWSTQFGDTGLQLLSEHLQKLQVLNLCETPVTDRGLSSLAAMKSLRKLNLNSTHLSALTFEGLKEKLPALQECDVRYTDAW